MTPTKCTPKPLVFAFLGRRRAGKSTAAKYVREIYGAEVLSLAGPLKLLGAKIYNLTPDQLTTYKEVYDDRWGDTPRGLLQKLGTEYCREVFGADFWVKQTIEKIKSMSALGTQVFCIDDVRFPNEVAALLQDTSIDVCVIKVVWPDHILTEADKHPSERGVDEVSYGSIWETLINRRDEAWKDALDRIVTYRR